MTINNITEKSNPSRVNIRLIFLLHTNYRRLLGKRQVQIQCHKSVDHNKLIMSRV